MGLAAVSASLGRRERLTCSFAVLSTSTPCQLRITLTTAASALNVYSNTLSGDISRRPPSDGQEATEVPPGCPPEMPPTSAAQVQPRTSSLHCYYSTGQASGP